jgi:hypothetical protein
MEVFIPPVIVPQVAKHPATTSENFTVIFMLLGKKTAFI